MLRTTQVSKQAPEPHHRWAGPWLAARSTPIAAAVLLAAALSGCIEAPELYFYATNESDEQVILNGDVGSTVVLPPHSFMILDRGSRLTGGWRIEIVDASCNPRSVVTIADGDQYVIVDSDGNLSHAAIHSVVGQSRVGPATEAPPQTCPRPRERPVGG